MQIVNLLLILFLAWFQDKNDNEKVLLWPNLQRLKNEISNLPFLNIVQLGPRSKQSLSLKVWTKDGH